MKKETIIQLVIIVILIITLGILVSLVVKQNKSENSMQRQGKFEMQEEKETKASDVDVGQEVTVSNIDLSQYNSNITITKAGKYTLKGEFKHSVLVNAESDVTLILNEVNIQNNLTAAIANIGTSELIIKLADNSNNTLSDGGASEYDACIYSNGKLTIEGNGTLNVYGNQEEGEGIATETNDITINGGIINIECQDDGINAGGDGGLITINDGEIYIKANGDGIDSNKNLVINGGNVYTMGSSIGGDAGIDTDDGFEINGGTVIALGTDMLEKPEKTSKQKSVCFSLNTKISNGTKVSLKNELDEEIISFEAKEDFRTLIISNSKLTSGTYYLYKDGEKTDYTAEV
ncbi:carbohydrate-binding domain-containing protein [Thomasclavelia cocleata]|uniref:carbohydrate-binding domain-containing protein n=1 Tax=Thomasclavelia cocleata TaxID=69824 RepID=UPI00272EB0EE|nr:carbohydrate-binding domain-containing protein [Thomasclavelia cocleata]